VVSPLAAILARSLGRQLKELPLAYCGTLGEVNQECAGFADFPGSEPPSHVGKKAFGRKNAQKAQKKNGESRLLFFVPLALPRLRDGQNAFCPNAQRSEFSS
jgi:hypothetical protein